LDGVEFAVMGVQGISAMRVKAGKLAPHAARRLERLQAVLAGRGECLFHSNELQRSHVQPRHNRAICPVAYSPNG